MKPCPKCQTLHDKEGIYCSRSCANSRVQTEEMNQSRRDKLLGQKNGERNIGGVEPGWVNKWRESCSRTWLEKYKNTPFEELGPENKKRRVFEEQQGCCAHCGLSEWQGQRLPLELDHKDGISDNNSRDNLEYLCPNCHSLTPTWRGRNKRSKNGKFVVSDEVLLECLLTTNNMREGLLKAGLAAKGKNYWRAKKLLENSSPKL